MEVPSYHKLLGVGNNVYVVWSDNSTGNGEIHFRGSTGYIRHISKPKISAINPGDTSEPRIVAYQNNVFVVWSDDSTGNGDIYMKISTDNANDF